ncbi:predicted protein [Sclerotinia sclerotiorum 1980 UF-70]|uniref:Uncharacterized protein n=1 Tax=Sclerotinia sclerotiorum (strain ATCC 18683 / 1980 / Ss-1) TaxID=665079 RepID=A7EX77_SCLS1|nr:predicted protein [Sclerotinia sclerotiorum 1980 UF-70]EDN94069.1 predicted protein [Sclerotinia sclerotiorum 1980 UF-70]
MTNTGTKNQRKSHQPSWQLGHSVPDSYSHPANIHKIGESEPARRYQHDIYFRLMLTAGFFSSSVTPSRKHKIGLSWGLNG